MDKRPARKKTGAELGPVLFDKLKLVKNGHLSIIKQDGKIIQIDICDRIITGPDTGPVMQW
jgi:hypothetical protein